MAKQKEVRMESHSRFRSRRFKPQSSYARRREEFREEYYNEQRERLGLPRGEFGRREQAPGKLRRIFRFWPRNAS